MSANGSSRSVDFPASSSDPLARPTASAGPWPSSGTGLDEARRGVLHVLRFLGRRWWVLLLVTGGLLYAVHKYAESLPRVYGCSPAVIELVQELPRNAQSIESYDYAASTLAYNVVPTQQAVLSTSQVLEPVVKSLGLEEDPEYSHLAGRVVTSAQDRTSLISLTVQGPDPEMNAKVANEIARVYQGLRADERNKFLNDMVAAADAQVLRRQKDLKATEDDIQAFRERNGLVDVAAEDETVRTRLRSLYPLVKAAEEKRDKDVEAEAQVLAAEKDRRDVGEVGAVRDDPEVRKEVAELRHRKETAETLALTLNEDKAQLRGARAQYDEQKLVVDRLTRSRAEDIKIAAQESRKRVQTLQAENAAAEADLKRIVALRVEFMGLDGFRDRANRLLAEARDDARAFNDLKSSKTEPVRVRQWAKPPLAVVSPRLG